MYIQDTTSTVSRPQRIGAVALFLAAVSATTTFAAPAHAHQEIHGGASSASTTAKDIGSGPARLRLGGVDQRAGDAVVGVVDAGSAEVGGGGKDDADPCAE